MEVSVYILRCADGSYYTGITKRPVEERVWEHQNKVVDGYTSRRLPVEVVFCEIFPRIDEAIDRERQIKGWSRRKKAALIRGDYTSLPKLSQSKPRPSTGSG